MQYASVVMSSVRVLLSIGVVDSLVKFKGNLLTAAARHIVLQFLYGNLYASGPITATCCDSEQHSCSRLINITIKWSHPSSQQCFTSYHDCSPDKQRAMSNMVWDWDQVVCKRSESCVFTVSPNKLLEYATIMVSNGLWWYHYDTTLLLLLNMQRSTCSKLQNVPVHILR